MFVNIIILILVVCHCLLTNGQTESAHEVCDTSCRNCTGGGAGDCTACKNGLLQQPHNGNVTFLCVSTCSEGYFTNDDKRCILCVMFTSHANCTHNNGSVSNSAQSSNSFLIVACATTAVLSCMTCSAVLAFSLRKRIRNKCQGSPLAEQQMNYYADRESELHCEPAYENVTVHVYEKITRTKSQLSKINNIRLSSSCEVNHLQTCSAKSHPQSIPGAPLYANQYMLAGDSSHESGYCSINPAQLEQEDNIRSLREQVWTNREQLASVGVVASEMDLHNGKLIIEIDGKKDEVVSELKKVIKTEDVEANINVIEVDYSFVLQNGTSYGIGSTVYCAGLKCGRSGTLGGFVRVSTGPGELEGFGILTAGHTILCEECQKNPQREYMIFVKDDCDAHLMVSDKFTRAPKNDAALVILNELQCRNIKDGIVPALFASSVSQSNYVPIDSGPNSKCIEEGMKVQKYGAKTERTAGTVKVRSKDFLKRSLYDVFLVSGDEKEFSDCGDSGSLVTSILQEDGVGEKIEIYGMVLGSLVYKDVRPNVTYVAKIDNMFQELKQHGCNCRFISVAEYDTYKYVDFMALQLEKANRGRMSRQSGIYENCPVRSPSARVNHLVMSQVQRD